MLAPGNHTKQDRINKVLLLLNIAGVAISNLHLAGTNEHEVMPPQSALQKSDSSGLVHREILVTARKQIQQNAVDAFF